MLPMLASNLLQSIELLGNASRLFAERLVDGITADEVMTQFGLTQERLMELARQGITWALPNLLLGSVVILPVWFLVYLFRPPRPRSD